MRRPDNQESPAARLYSLIRGVYQTRDYLQYKPQKARHTLAESEVANGRDDGEDNGGIAKHRMPGG
jgi:hypothetical protein